MLLTILIWILASLIYISDRNNNINKGFAKSLLFFSLGAFKEYLYYDLWPLLPEAMHADMLEAAALACYSIITAGLYAFAGPLFLLSTLNFSEPAYKKRINKFLKAVMWIPGIILLIIFPPMNFDMHQHSGHVFWYTFSIYNMLYAVFITFLQFKAVLTEKDPIIRRQKRFVVMIVLPPLWFCVVTIYVIHSLWIEPLLKLWKANTFIVAIVIILYLFLAFREGIMGTKLRRENYCWDTDMKTINKGAWYTSHILKNEITKVEWSISNLEKKYAEDLPEELAIIRRSTQHLKKFVEKTQLYSNDILLDEECCDVKNLIELSILSTKEYIGYNITFELNIPENSSLLCDKEHIIEVLNNLLMNGADAMNKQGKIYISFEINERKHLSSLSVIDEGTGIDTYDTFKLFDPYFTTKKTNMHFGLGLAYSANVMRKHGGYIDVKSEQGKGSTFILCFNTKDGVKK